MVQSLRGIDFDIYEKIAKKIWDLFDKEEERRDSGELIDALGDILEDKKARPLFEKLRKMDIIRIVRPAPMVWDENGNCLTKEQKAYFNEFPNFETFASYCYFVAYLGNSGINISELADIISINHSSRYIWKTAYGMFKADVSIEEIFEYLNVEAVAIRLSES